MSELIPSLGGYIPIRNNFTLGYCVFEGIASLLKICSEVVVVDAESTDGTLEALQRLADQDKRVKVVTFPWTDPHGVGADYFIDWLNHGRKHLTSKHQITLDGDEILDSSQSCYDAIRDACASENPARRFLRLNYWRDAHSLIPEGNCCSHAVVRLGLQSMKMSTDAQTDPKEFPLNEIAVYDKRLIVHHVGFLRPKDLFYAKSKVVQKIWVNGYDSRLVEVEAKGKHQSQIENCDWTDKLVSCDVPMPDDVQRLLASWGVDVPDYLPRTVVETDPIITVEAWS